MKKSIKIIAALCLMAALILSLAACGDKKDELVGMWETVIYGNKATMLINEDGTLYLLEIDNDGDIDGEVVIWGDIFNVDARESRDGRFSIINFNFTRFNF